MKRILSRLLLSLFLLVPFACFTSYAQDLTGIWKGYFISDQGEYYKLEFQVSQGASYAVTGVSYSYLDVRFYGKATMTGTFIKTSSSFRIREIRTVEVKSTLGGATCIMNYNFEYSKSGKEEFLEGTYLGKYETKDKTGPPPSWGDCGGGKVHLRKVTTSDFYVEPFLRNKIKTTPVIINQPPTKKITTPPVAKKDSGKVNVKTTPPVKKPILTTKPPVAKKDSTKVKVTTTTPVKKPVVTTKPPVIKPITKPVTDPVTKTKIDTTQKVQPPVIKTNPQSIVPTPAVLKNRSNELVKTLVVNDPDVIVKFYDNGEIDGDTISVYFDKKLVLSKKGLTASALELNLKMDEDNSQHELVMVAENLGRIPPNTSLMIVESGEQRFEVRITSTEQKNAVVRFKYQK
jgi:hypothetical protein